MGRKQTRTRKHIYLSIAGLISFLLLSCTSLEKMKVETQEQQERRGNPTLLRSEELLYQGDYEGALKECEKILSLPSSRSQNDRVLFNIGLIYAHSENPKKNYGKSLGSFKRLMKEYPESPLAGQAKIWMGVLMENERLSQRNEKLNQSNEKLNQTNERLSQTVEKLNQVIEKSKQVDIEIDEKKREKAK